MNEKLQYIVDHFETEGAVFVEGKRNIIKLFDYEGKSISVKSFKKPHFINSIVYRFFRQSKAKRSFLYAKILESYTIGTPKPIAFFEKKSSFRLLESYYLCEHLYEDLVFRDLFNYDYPDIEKLLKSFTRFTYSLHENGIEFLDHSPGNTLIKKGENGAYSFYLVDLNRMKFHKKMTFDTRMKNFARITPSKEMIEIISSEYALLINQEANFVFDAMWKKVSSFQNQFHRKIRVKKAFLFWKNQ